MGMTHDQLVQERIASALERIERLLTPKDPPQPAEAQPAPITRKRGRPPKVRNAEDV